MHGEKAAMRIRTVSVSGPSAVVLVFLVAFLLQCGDVEANPGPPKKQSLLSQQHQGQSPGGRGASTSSSDEPTISDIARMLSAMDQKMTTMDRKMDSMHATMQEQMEKMQSDFAEVVKENKELKGKVEKLEDKLDDLEGRSRRNNLIFHGIAHPQGRAETWADCEKAVQTMLKEELGMEEEVEIERAHRLRGGQSPRPIIACFRSFKDKERILSERRKLKDNNSNVFINEDFSPRVREKRRHLQPFLREAKAASKRAYLRFDTLVIEGRTYLYDAVTQGLVERQGQR